MQSTPLKKSGVFVELLASFPWLHGDLPHTAHTVAERVVLCRGAWFWNKILQDAMAENLDKQWIRITGTRDAPALAPPALRRKKSKRKQNPTSFLWLCRKKNQTQAMCLLFRRRRFERNCRKSKWQPHPTFFSGWWLSHDWICWVMGCLLSQVILLEKIRETLGPQTKTNTECMQSTPLKKKWGFCRTAC